LIRNDYIPLTKIYFYDVITRDNTPIFLVTLNSLKIPLDIDQYIENTPSRIGNEDATLHFVFKMIDSTKELMQKCKFGLIQTAE
jgi:hypothetical protein